ncbi:hypothetical protein [Clostridium sp. DL1XJH146]
MSENVHAGCSGEFENGKQTVDKVRMMGFNTQFMPIALTINCEECGDTFEMETFESKCPKCGMVYGVTPCHAHDPESVKPAGIDY